MAAPSQQSPNGRATGARRSALLEKTDKRLEVFKTIGRNIAASWTGYAVQVAVTFFLTPFVVGTLGDARYGAWTVIMGLTGYYGLLDLGFRSGLTQYLARYLAVKDFARLNHTASTGCTSLCFISLVLLGVSVGLAAGAPYLFDLPENVISEVRWSILIVGLAIAIQFPFFCFSAALTAAQRYDISNAIGVVTRLMSAALIVVGLQRGYGLVGIATATLATNLLDYVLRFVAAHRVIPELRVRLGAFDREAFKDFFTFGLWNTATSASRRIMSYGSTLVIAMFLPVAAVTPFALSASIAEYLNRLLAPTARVFFPAATQLDANGEHDKLQSLYLNGSRFMFTVAVAAGLIGAVWADDFFRLWIGLDSVNEYGSAAELCRWLLLATVFSVGQRVGYQVLLGKRRVKALAVLFSIEAAITLSLCVLFVGPFGLTGVAMASVVPAFLMQLCIHPVVLCRLLELPLLTYGIRVQLPTLSFGLLSGFSLYYLHDRILPAPQTWFDLASQGGIAAVVVSTFAFLLCLNPSERRERIFNPLQRRWRSLSGHAGAAEGVE